MAQYRVIMTGESRETYIVEADSPDEAARAWSTGWLASTEAFGMDVVSVEEDA